MIVPVPIEVVTYDPGWPQVFEELRGRVAQVLDGLFFRTEHVGSTAISGCAAKPVIDMDVILTFAGDVGEVIDRLSAAGYVHKGDGGIPGREAFAPPGDLPRHHLYVCIRGGRELQRHLLFRDYLRKHPEEVLNYSRLKERLAREFREDREAYTRAKTSFIEGILDKAGASSGHAIYDSIRKGKMAREG